jgi:rRNA maturation endonuclease Nob1
LDTSYFIKLKPLELLGNKYYTTEFIIKEIRDEKVKLVSNF